MIGLNSKFNKREQTIKKILRFLNFKTNAQLLEDLVLCILFFDINKGFYIDIGANDPNIHSVTKYFYLKGWNGINIEPLDVEYSFYLKNRTRDINLQLIIDDKEGNLTLYHKGESSTTNTNYSFGYTNKTNVKAQTMKYVCDKYIPKNKEIHFCKIDVEGAERKVLLGFDFKNYRPKIFCIESTIPATKIPIQNKFEDILFKNGYSFIYQYDINRFYIDNNVIELKERLFLIDDIITTYKKYKRYLP